MYGCAKEEYYIQCWDLFFIQKPVHKTNIAAISNMITVFMVRNQPHLITYEAENKFSIKNTIYVYYTYPAIIIIIFMTVFMIYFFIIIIMIIKYCVHTYQVTQYIYTYIE